MNRETRLNRPKKQRIQAEKHGSQAKDVVYTGTEKINAMAADKTPSHLRTGNYYTQVKSHVPGAHKGPGNTYMNLKPIHKLTSKVKPEGLFDIVGTLKKFFGIGGVVKAQG